MPFNPFPLMFEPGIQRDNTAYSTNAYTDGRWMRFQYGKPRKIGGYFVATPNLTGLSRCLLSQTQSGYTYIHSGFAAGIESVQVQSNGSATTPANRTPIGFVSNANNMWSLDSYYDINSGTQQVLAFVVPSLFDIGYGSTTGTLYAGPIYNTTPLVQVTDPSIATDVTGGICVAPPYTVLYGSNGLFQWSMPGQPLVFTDPTNTGQTGAARITNQKIVKVLPLRGGGGFSPSMLCWSLDALIRVYFVGLPTVFAFDTLSAQSSILSPNCVMEADGTFYWAGVDRFLMYNGVVRELPNPRNLNFFFDNLNRTYAQKAFIMRNPRYGEIWFCAPLFGATEPNYAVIYNYREGVWYDTKLPNSGRSFGIQNEIAGGTFMSGIDLYQNSTYRLWEHEQGTDEIDVSNTNAINSFYTTGIMSAETFQQPMDSDVMIDTVIPDLLQTGAMTLSANTRGNARSPFVVRNTVAFQPAADSAADQQVPLRVAGKQITLTFTSNVAGGTYQTGKSIAYIRGDAGRRTQ